MGRWSVGLICSGCIALVTCTDSRVAGPDHPMSVSDDPRPQQPSAADATPQPSDAGRTRDAGADAKPTANDAAAQPARNDAAADARPAQQPDPDDAGAADTGQVKTPPSSTCEPVMLASGPVGFSGCGALRAWVAPEVPMDGHTALSGFVPVQGMDGFLTTLGVYGDPSGEVRESHHSLERFDESGACVERLFEWKSSLGPLSWAGGLAFAARGSMRAFLYGVGISGQGGSTHDWSALVVDGKEVATFVTTRAGAAAPPGVIDVGPIYQAQPELMRLTQDGRIVLSGSYYNAEFGPGVGTNAWVLSREGKVLASAEWGAPGNTRVRALQVAGQDEILVLGDVTPKVDSGMGLDPTHRIDHYGINLKLIDSWSPPAGMRLNGISANASGHLAIVGKRQDRAFVQVLEINGWKVGPELAAPDGEAWAAELRDDGELVVVGSTSANLQWLQRYTRDGKPIWPEPKTLPTPPNMFGWSGAVAVQSNGHILATVTQQLAYCDP